jgi:hypothetical protein
VEWGRSSSEGADHRTSPDTQSLGSGMETGPVASSIPESDQVGPVLGAQVTTLVVDACMEKYDRWPPSYSELDYLVRTLLALERENDSSEAKSTWARNSNGCSVVEGGVVPQSCAVARVGKPRMTMAGELDGCWLEPVGMHA